MRNFQCLLFVLKRSLLRYNLHDCTFKVYFVNVSTMKQTILTRIMPKSSKIVFVNWQRFSPTAASGIYKQKQLPDVLYKKVFLKIGLFFKKIAESLFLINFLEQFFYRTPLDHCFCTVSDPVVSFIAQFFKLKHDRDYQN